MVWNSPLNNQKVADFRAFRILGFQVGDAQLVHICFVCWKTLRILKWRFLHTSLLASMNGKQRFSRRERPVSCKLPSMCHLLVDLFSVSRQLRFERPSVCAAFIFHKCSAGCPVQMQCLAAGQAACAGFVGRLLVKSLKSGFMCDALLDVFTWKYPDYQEVHWIGSFSIKIPNHV